MSITLHPKHGVNPPLDVCFWCGEAVGVALLGRNKGKEAPRQIVTSYDPCDACQEGMDKGISLIEVTEVPNDRGTVSLYSNTGIFPTGRMVVVKEDGISEDFPHYEATMKHRKCFMTVADFTELLGDVA